MEPLKRDSNETHHPLKVIQFGEGNFLRAFIDWMIDNLNEKSDFNGSVAIIQPLERGMIDVLQAQDGLYHHVRQGIENGKTVDEIRRVSCISKAINPFNDLTAYFELASEPELQLVFSNTTEAGIVFEADDKPAEGKLAKTFPGKLTQLLKKRFDHFNGAEDKGVAIIPCELIEQNGTKLKEAIDKYIQLWDLGSAFKNWIFDSCSFANTLVDRIVPGYPKDEIETLLDRIGYDDKLVVKSETFHLFVIQAPEKVKELFPANKIGLNVKFVDDITPYRTQKVRILNGAHTAMVPIGLLNGIETVREAVEDEQTGKVIREIIFDEIVPTIQIPGEDPADFAEEIVTRFKNPFIRHELMSISLNSISKFKVRVLPTILDYQKIKGSLPNRLVFSLACLIKLYVDRIDELKDDAEFIDFFKERQSADAEALVSDVLSNTSMWGQDLSEVTDMKEVVLNHYKSVSTSEMTNVLLNI